MPCCCYLIVWVKQSHIFDCKHIFELIFKLPCTCSFEWIKIQLRYEEDIHQHHSGDVRSIIYEKVEWGFSDLLRKYIYIYIYINNRSQWFCQLKCEKTLIELSCEQTTLGSSRITQSEKARTTLRVPSVRASVRMRSWTDLIPGGVSISDEGDEKPGKLLQRRQRTCNADLSSTNWWHSWQRLGFF